MQRTTGEVEEVAQERVHELSDRRTGAALQADEARNKSILDRIPAGAWGDPSDLGGAAVFLSSAAANYVQGHILAVDGGWLAR